MKYILNYETVCACTESEGQVNYVTSITPGVGYVAESRKSIYNKSAKITFKIESLDNPAAATFNRTATCQDIWDLVIETMGGTEPETIDSIDTYGVRGYVYGENQNFPGMFFEFTWDSLNSNKPVCEKVQMFSDNVTPMYEYTTPPPSMYSAETGEFNENYYGCTIVLRAMYSTVI